MHEITAAPVAVAFRSRHPRRAALCACTTTARVPGPRLGARVVADPRPAAPAVVRSSASDQRVDRACGPPPSSASGTRATPAAAWPGSQPPRSSPPPLAPRRCRRRSRSLRGSRWRSPRPGCPPGTLRPVNDPPRHRRHRPRVRVALLPAPPALARPRRARPRSAPPPPRRSYPAAASAANSPRLCPIVSDGASPIEAARSAHASPIAAIAGWQDLGARELPVGRRRVEAGAARSGNRYDRSPRS